MTTTVQDLLALPASPAQERFWIVDQLKKGDPSLNVAVRFLLTGALDTAALIRALNLVVARHETLRANFEQVDGRLAQIVVPEREIEVPVTDLSNLEPTRQRAEADRLADEIARQSFALEAGPLIRARLLRCAPEQHILLITVHHIVSDGWSIGVITDEIRAAYEAYSAGREPRLPELAIQYADFALWKNEQTAGDVGAESYWRERLSGLPRFEMMPDFARSPLNDGKGHIVSRLLPKRLTQKLQAFALNHDSTLFMAYYAALCALLSRYTGETDIVTGTHFACRDAVEVEPLIGPFAQNLVLRTDTAGDPTFVELLDRASETISGALLHPDIPYDRITAGRGDGGPLFSINFIHQRDFVKPWQCGTLRMDPIPSRSPGAWYDLNLFLVERVDGWRLSCEYNTSLYRMATVELLLEHFELLLTAIAADPYRCISEYDFLTQSEQRCLLSEWNNTAASYPTHLCVHDLLRLAAARTPGRVAAEAGPETITYEQLDAWSNRIARYLKSRGARPGVYVGICMDRSLDMLAAVLAVLKTGAAYLPLDPAFPASRLEFMSEDADIRILVTSDSQRQRIQTGACVVNIDRERLPIGAESPLPLEDKVSSDGVAYILYTSGSTGKPKGVEVQHRSVINMLYGMQAHLQLGEADSVLAITTLSFDIATLELYLPLITGARIILASQKQAADPLELREVLARVRPTFLQATPVTWRMLIDAGWNGTPGLKMLCGGEKMTPELATALLSRGGILWNAYGPTETAVWSTIGRVEPGETITIGRPIANTLIYILDTQLRLLPLGVPGEIYIGGDGVAKGYRNRLELNAQRFLSNPFGPGRLYRTGDIGRYLPGGNIEILGRNDAQVKVRGFRIELGEVEAALAAVEGVRAAAVAVRTDPAGENMLAGYFVPRAGVDAGAVRQALSAKLPPYMVPTWLVAMAELPVTPNGKLDRKALPEPQAAQPAPAVAEISPADPLEATLISIWESVLGVAPVRRQDNFFELGGHSVLAARMFTRLEKAIGKSLPLATLFQAPTIAKLASLIRDTDWKPSWSPLVAIRPSGSKPPFFFVHPIGGNVLNFAGFSSHFGEDQPIYGLQARGLGGDEAPHTSIELMAADYVRAIRTVQPEGPYAIGGFSAGGVVAFEMARQLRHSGQEVSLLALLDTGIRSGRALTFGERLRRHAFILSQNLRYAARVAPIEYLDRKRKNLAMRLQLLKWNLREKLGLANDPAMLSAEEAFLLAMRGYTPVPFNGDAVLFRAGDDYLDPNLGWGNIIRGRLDIEITTGDHDTILHEPHIGMLAQLIQKRLNTILANHKSSQRSAA